MYQITNTSMYWCNTRNYVTHHMRSFFKITTIGDSDHFHYIHMYVYNKMSIAKNWNERKQQSVMSNQMGNVTERHVFKGENVLEIMGR